jgi:hypothetical protein
MPKDSSRKAMMSIVPFRQTGEGKRSRSPSRDKPSADGPYKRKLIGFDADTWHALHLLAHDTMKDFQEITDEAFADLLKKYHRPVGLKEALRQSAREHSANSNHPDTEVRPSTAAKAGSARRRRTRA